MFVLHLALIVSVIIMFSITAIHIRPSVQGTDVSASELRLVSVPPTLHISP